MSELFNNFSTLPPYLQYEILVDTSPEDFPNLCSINKNISQICSGNLNQEQKLLYGNQITDRLYRERSQKWFGEDILNFKEPTMSWKEFLYKNCKIIWFK